MAFLPLSPDYRRRRAASPDEAGGLILLRKAQAAARLGGRPAARQRRGAVPAGSRPARHPESRWSRRRAGGSPPSPPRSAPSSTPRRSSSPAVSARTRPWCTHRRAGQRSSLPSRRRWSARPWATRASLVGAMALAAAQDPGEPHRQSWARPTCAACRVPAVTDGPAPRIRPATPADAVELLRLRILLLESLGRDPGPPSAPWRQDALRWFVDRTTTPRWRIQVAADDECGHLLAFGAATVAEHLPGPTRPTGLKAYIASMVTDPCARGQGLARSSSMSSWTGPHNVVPTSRTSTRQPQGSGSTVLPVSRTTRSPP